MNNKKELRLGLIGAGRRGAFAQYMHQPENNVFLTAAADTDPEALKAFQETIEREVYVTQDYHELLARPDIDAVLISTPDDLHEEHAIAALKAGKGVYLEKPIAITIEGCDRILETARKQNGKLYVGHNLRHFAVMRKMKELIDSGAIGEVKTAWCRHFISYGGDAYYKDWHAERSRTTSLLLQKGAHDIDVLHWLCGGYTETVTAMGELSLYNRITDRRDPKVKGDTYWNMDNWPPLSQKGLNPVIDVEDINMMLMRLDNGVLATYQQCHYSPDAWRNYTIIGTEGRIENFGDMSGECMIKLWNKRHNYQAEGDAEFIIPKEEGSHGGADPKIIDEFIRYMRDEGGGTITSPVSARYSAVTGCKATESLRNGAIPVQVPRLPKDLSDYFDKSTGQ
ncbi:Gfo/Idh/MocA family oxidoreductase [Coraliomargarita sp. SDUM461004]|uniref:Gfo/Idh/MocA family oxidoreductase n=1 Tax=Thalassobacterium sedimentorum TaxID=3041258 RepID=A0ABU1AE69_9BACT|nr:Gfo/Idh/MocA family oxidoreductase [Coraliomargarita sp. SDUM461004]MDQ8192990.1 Gfo/Idh/MocA family oxidoreductase [Coraliomargarita sp. SDUM461004]